MPNKLISMQKIRQVLRFYAQGGNSNVTAPSVQSKLTP